MSSVAEYHFFLPPHMLASEGMLDVLTRCSFLSAVLTPVFFFSFTAALPLPVDARSVRESAPTTSCPVEGGLACGFKSEGVRE